MIFAVLYYFLAIIYDLFFAFLLFQVYFDILYSTDLFFLYFAHNIVLFFLYYFLATILIYFLFFLYFAHNIFYHILFFIFIILLFGSIYKCYYNKHFHFLKFRLKFQHQHLQIKVSKQTLQKHLLHLILLYFLLKN